MPAPRQVRVVVPMDLQTVRAATVAARGGRLAGGMLHRRVATGIVPVAGFD